MDVQCGSEKGCKILKENEKTRYDDTMWFIHEDYGVHKMYFNTYRRTFTNKKGKKVSKAPKIKRFVTPLTLQRKRARIADKKKRIAKANFDAAEYQKVLASKLKEHRDRRSESLARKRSKLDSTAAKPVAA